ncbi:hypothetical protein BD779DRAFT_1678609 [Infundibulicybe gibba]|nr:hypothetical protein BD779DRAFT_1678609 [Infundibulicybe gibba]
MLLRLALSLLPFVGPALSQLATKYTDPDNGLTFWGITDPVHFVTYGYVFPPLNSTGVTATEFIGEIVAPIGTGWAGVSPNGAMLQNLLLVAWAYEDSIVSSARFATNYVQPTAMSGPVLTDLPTTKVNSTHWKWVYRCQNCVAWSTTAGTSSLPLSGFGAAAWVQSDIAVDTPSDPQSTFAHHTDFGFYGFNFSQAHVSAAQYSSWTAGVTDGSTSEGNTTVAFGSHL